MPSKRTQPVKRGKAAPPPPPAKELRTSFLFRHLEPRHRVALEVLQQAWNKSTLNATLVALVERYSSEAEQARKDRAKLEELERLLEDLREVHLEQQRVEREREDVRKALLSKLPLVDRGRQLRID